MIGPDSSGSSRKRGLFPLGSVMATANAVRTLRNHDILLALSRHVAGDWGDVCPDDWRSNDRAVDEGARLLSVYHTSSGMKFYVITEADRSATTVLLPEDY